MKPKSVFSRLRRLGTVLMLAPRSAIDDMIRLIDRLTLEDAGVYYEWTGRVIPW